MSFYTEGDKVVRQAIRKEMLRQTYRDLEAIYSDPAWRKAASRVMVDRALAQERANELSNPKLPA